MGREVKRVPLDFDAPLDRGWAGYDMPDDLDALQCPDCETGYSPRGAHLHAMWYGNVPFRPEDNGSTPLTPDTSAVRRFAERNVTSAPGFYGRGERAIHMEAIRLCHFWNGSWSHHLNADDVAALVSAGRLMYLTHTFDQVNRWQPKDPPVMPTPQEVNEWSISGRFGHDPTNVYVVVRARCAREGVPVECETCGGSGQAWRDDAHKAAHEAWEATEPPEGEGWQLWQTVSDGPISPVFPTADGLIEWMTTPAAKWGAMGPWSRGQAAVFVNGPGWAPTGVGDASGYRDGVTAMVSAAVDVVIGDMEDQP